MSVPPFTAIMIQPLAHSPQFITSPSGYSGETGVPEYPDGWLYVPLFASRRLHRCDPTDDWLPSFGSVPRHTSTSKAPRSSFHWSLICLYLKKVAVAPVSLIVNFVPAFAGAFGGSTAGGAAVTVSVAVTVTVGADSWPGVAHEDNASTARRRTTVRFFMVLSEWRAFPGKLPLNARTEL